MPSRASPTWCAAKTSPTTRHGDSARAAGTYGFANCVGDAIAVCEQVIGTPAVLVRGADGEKLSKQHGAPPLETSDPLKALQRAAEMLGLSPVPAQTQVTDALAHWVMAWRALYNPAP